MARRVLIVEDDGQMAQIMASAIGMVCDEVVIVETLKEAMAELYAGEISLVILDLMLPDSRAMDTLNSIPAIKAAGAPRVVCVTASEVGPSLLATAIAIGAEDVIAKSVRFWEKLHNIFADDVVRI